MKNTITQPTTSCPQCNKGIELEEIKRIYGKESDVYKHKFCSAKCFTLFITANKTQPQHTQEEKMSVAYHTRNTIGATINYKTVTLFTTEHPDNCRATLDEIVKTVNMHDKFIDSIKTGLTLLQASLDILKKEYGNTTVISHLDCIMDEQQQLLKQAEQK